MRRSRAVLSVVGALASAVLIAAATVAEEPSVPTGDADVVVESLSGVVRQVEDADGDTEYELVTETGAVRLSVGPPWFWGDDHPLVPYVDSQAEVTGVTDDGQPAPQANERVRDRADREPSFDVFTINGHQIRSPGRPPWAGGPRVVGERHPGFPHGVPDDGP